MLHHRVLNIWPYYDLQIQCKHKHVNTTKLGIISIDWAFKKISTEVGMMDLKKGET